MIIKWKESESEHEVAPSCPTVYDPMDCRLPGSLSMGFSGQEHWSGLLFFSPGDHPNLGLEPRSLSLQADSLLSELPGREKSTMLQ